LPKTAILGQNYINDKDVAVTSIEYVAVTILFLKEFKEDSKWKSR
jgi:hypothetical protein